MRNDALDIAKGVGILLVVLGHALEINLVDAAASPATFAVWKFIYAFHMPLFFLLAGMATPRLSGVPAGKALSAAVGLILLAAVLQLLFAPLRLAFPLPGDGPSTLAAILWPAIKLESYALVVIWFLPCLALVRLAAWTAANTGRLAAGGLILGLGLACLLEHRLGVGYFQLRTIIIGLGFFALGQSLADRSLARLPRPALWTILALSLVLTLVTFDANHGCTRSFSGDCPGPRYGAFAVLMASGAIGFPPLFALTALSGAAAVLSVALLLCGRARFLSLLGRRSLDLLIVNGVTLVFVQPHLAGLPQALILPPLGALQIAAAFTLHRPLHAVHTICRTAAARLSRVLDPVAQAPKGVPT